MNLYEVLGVAKDAVKSEIKKAFKKKAQESHPDRAGGDIKIFQQVNTAYEVLSDDERRKRYDETGDTGRPQSEQSKAEELIIGLFASIIEQEDFSGDLIERSRQVVSDKVSETQKQLEKLGRKIAKLTKQLGRITTKGENMFQIVLERSIEQLQQSVTQAEENLSLLNIVSDLLDQYQDSSPQIDVQPTFNMSEQLLEMMRRQRATGFGGFDRG